MRLFISYARDDSVRVDDLHDNLTDAGHTVWVDRELRGGEDWWHSILEEIQSVDIFLFVLSPDSARSRACRRELTYARAVNRPIIPIMVRNVEMERAPDELQQINVMDFLNPSVRSWMRLMTNIQETPQQQLPNPLPEAPGVPIADLREAREMAERDSLDKQEQNHLLGELREAVRDPDNTRAVVAVLERFRQRQDLLEVVARETDELMLTHRVAPDRQFSPLVRSIVADLKNSRCTPVLGSGLTDWLFGSRRDLAQKWANEYPFPMAPHWSDDLPQVTQYAAVTYSDFVLRDDLGAFYREQLQHRYPEIVDARRDMTLGELALAVWVAEAPDHADEPHVVLASLPCSIYVTAQATTLLVRALQDAGKEPVTDFCRWKPELMRDSKEPLEDPAYEPTVDRPLVYHVFGTLDVPESIVITEDEYFDFLAAVARSGPNQLIPSVIEEALADTSLLFLGFGLQDWNLRILLRSVITRESAPRKGMRAKHVAAELDLVRGGATSPEKARDYMVSYFQKNEPAIEIEWASVDEFSADLAHAWEMHG
ncbi:MAG: TIR domain-containing protein [Acidimicrobiia bacterium]